MCGKRNDGFGVKVIATFAGFVSLTCVFTAARPPEAAARVVPNPNIRHYFRQTVIPTGEAGEVRIGLWILNPVSGRIRLCLLDEPQAGKKDFLKCSAWLGGDDEPGRYTLLDIRRRLPHPYRRTLPAAQAGLAGVWILNYQTGAVRACVITKLDDPTGSLTCSATP